MPFYLSFSFTTFLTHWERLSISRGRKKSWQNSQTEWREKSNSSWFVAMPTVLQRPGSQDLSTCCERDRCSKVSHGRRCAVRVPSVWESQPGQLSTACSLPLRVPGGAALPLIFSARILYPLQPALWAFFAAVGEDP